MRAEQASASLACHAEGPVWCARWGGLRWVDMLAGDVLSLSDSGEVIAVERGFVLEDADGTLKHLAQLWTHGEARMNDGSCDPEGHFYCGSMAYDARPGAARLYRLDPDGSVRTVLEDVTISNGLEWSPGGTRAYYVDSATNRIDVFDYDGDAGLRRRRPFVSVPASAGTPDGLTVDQQGGVWVALFGGARLSELFITTSRENLAPGDDPLAGSLFRALVDVQGLPAREFAG